MVLLRFKQVWFLKSPCGYGKANCFSISQPNGLTFQSSLICLPTRLATLSNWICPKHNKVQIILEVQEKAIAWYSGSCFL